MRKGPLSFSCVLNIQSIYISLFLYTLIENNDVVVSSPASYFGSLGFNSMPVDHHSDWEVENGSINKPRTQCNGQGGSTHSLYLGCSMFKCWPRNRQS
jgi:hypothetical protein